MKSGARPVMKSEAKPVMKIRSVPWVVLAGVAVGAASCTQIFEANKDYQLTGAGGASSASTSAESSTSTSAQGTGGSGGGTACAPACGEGASCCGTTCADLASDLANCGMCGHACPTGDDCSASGCSDWAKWPMPNPLSTGLPNPASYVIKSGYVLDSVTGLWWQHPIDASNDLNKSCAAGCTAGEAITYCENLTLAGQSDWRLPTRMELVSIIDYTQHVPAIDPTAFAGTPVTGVGAFPGNDGYWTSSPVADNGIFSVEFAEGDSASANPDGMNVVRCVRGSAKPGTPHYTIKAGTVLDNWTGLTWQQAASSQTDTWANAMTACASNVAGLPGSGWRLPSMKELQTLVDDSRANPAIDPAAFPGTPFDVSYWTSSPVAFGQAGTRAWVVQFDEGKGPYDSVGHPYHFRCVR